MVYPPWLVVMHYTMQVVCLDLEAYMVEFSQPFFESSGLAQRIKPVIGPADETMLQLARQGDRSVPTLRAAITTLPHLQALPSPLFSLVCVAELTHVCWCTYFAAWQMASE
jgi:hypothetical protein